MDTALAREKTKKYILEDNLDCQNAIDKAIFTAMVETGKNYNIVFYLGTSKRAAKKVG